MNDLYIYENQLIEEGHKLIAGTDEVGRGPMAGPLVVAAVILKPGIVIEGLNDSKKLTSKMREKLALEIKEKALVWSVIYKSVEEVDKLNVYRASKLAMEEAVRKLTVKADYILSDAMPLDIEIPSLSIIKGDSKSASIAAASIIAKVERDQYMIGLDEVFPEYGFKDHKGYVTKKHLAAIEKYGICIHHRRSFEPVQRIINKITN